MTEICDTIIAVIMAWTYVDFMMMLICMEIDEEEE